MSVKRKNRFMSFVAAFLFATVLFGFSALAVQPKMEISLGSISTSKLLPDSQSGWHYQKSPSFALPGETEALSVPLHIPEKMAMGELSFTLNSSVLDLKQLVVFLVMDIDGVITAKPIIPKSSGRQASFSFWPEQIMREKTTKTFLYFSAPRTGNDGTLSLRMQREIPDSFGPQTVVSVGDYEVSKQGSGAAGVEPAAGLASLPKPDTVYCVSKNGSEVIRILLERGEIMGLAIADRQIVAGVEYSFDQKAYINTLNRKAVITRENLVDVFTQLECSFMRAPDEGKWFQLQPSLDVTRSATLG